MRKFNKPISLGSARMLLQWGRNFIVAEITRQSQTIRTIIMLQWGRNFIVAEIHKFQSRRGNKPHHASMGPQLYRCGNIQCLHETIVFGSRFNGAATLSLRKLDVLKKTRHTRECFNGAATLSLRKSVQVVCQATGRHSGFNGAATLSLRKSCRCLIALVCASMLQWGRNFIVAEIL